MTITLETPIHQLPRIGEVLAKRFSKLGLHTVQDLLWHFPFRYDDYSSIVPIRDIRQGVVMTIRGQVTLIANKRAYRRRMYVTEAIISDDTGSIKAVWFNQPFITKLLAQGDTAYFSGKAEMTQYGLQLAGPSYEKAKKEQTHTARIVPIYSLTERLTEKQLRYLIKMILPLAQHIPEWLPDEVLKKYGLISLGQALREVHFPTNKKTLAQARTRLKFNELLLVQLQAQSLRHRVRQEIAPAIAFNESLTKEFVARLPFRLTEDQRRATWTILKDLTHAYPMNRLLQGDVGSGKTVVATIAMLNVIAAGYQTALMAPTEILALQHHQTISRITKDVGNSVALLTHSQRWLDGKQVSKQTIAAAIQAGSVHMVIGTHALIQDTVEFASLGLVVIDEQHRFGVDQRKQLKLKSAAATPHLLSMTATPIPRSLALTVYGDLDISTILRLPPGRKKIMTHIVPPEKRDAAYGFIRKEIAAGRQAFVICPLIEESDKLGVRAATAEYDHLRKEVFPDLHLGLVHGKLKATDKTQAMDDFSQHRTDILVATAVVEVGIDVPNASIMMIEGAERFGLAQLHQFRGRVGRAAHQSYCLVFTETTSEKTTERLQALVTSANGFELAEKDLELRGPGELYGLRQSGFPELKIATLADYPIIAQAKECATQLIAVDPELKQFPDIQKRLRDFYQTIHLE